MTGFDIPTNYVEDREALIRRTRAKLKKVLALESEHNQTRYSLTLVFEAMADKTLHEFFASTTANICTRPAINIGDNAFELKLALINIVQASQFCGNTHEDASAQHIHHQRSYQRCHSTSPLSIFTFGEGEEMVLCQQR
jgi:hypothetical protein